MLEISFYLRLSGWNVKLGAFYQWWFIPNSARGSKETIAIRKTRLSITQLTYIKVDHDELGEFVPEVFHLSLLDLADLLELFSISDSIDRNTVVLDSNDMSIFPHHLSRWEDLNFNLRTLPLEFETLPSIQRGPNFLLPVFICFRNSSIGTYPTEKRLSLADQS